MKNIKKAFRGVEEVSIISSELKNLINKQNELEKILKQLMSATPNVQASIDELMNGYKDGIEEVLEEKLSEFKPTEKSLQPMQLAASSKKKNIKK